MSESVKILMDSLSSTAEATQPKLGFDEAFTLHHRLVYRCAYSVLSDALLAEDIVQEVFLKFYHHQDDIKNEEMLRPWLIRVALNLSRNALRHNIRANLREEKYFKESLETDYREPESDYEKSESIRAVRQALEQIREPLRSCLVLKHQGLSYKEIAATLSLNETSIGQYVARAKQEFAKIYGKTGEADYER